MKNKVLVEIRYFEMKKGTFHMILNIKCSLKDGFFTPPLRYSNYTKGTGHPKMKIQF